MLSSVQQLFSLSPPLLYLILFILGLFFGSFFNVIVMRASQEKSSWIKGRSRCDHCDHVIVWYDNIPLLSFLILQGKCRYCQAKIKLVHPVTEFLTGWVFVFAGFAFFKVGFFPDMVGFFPDKTGFFPGENFLLSLVLMLVFISILWLIFLFDLHYQVIPDELVFAIFLLAVIKNLFLYIFSRLSFRHLFLELVISLIITLFFLFLRVVPDKLFKKKGLGWGDIKLAGPLALLLGFPQALIGFFCAFIIGGVWGIILLITGNKKLGQKIAFGPFLVLGAGLALVWGELIWESYWKFLLT